MVRLESMDKSHPNGKKDSPNFKRLKTPRLPISPRGMKCWLTLVFVFTFGLSEYGVLVLFWEKEAAASALKGEQLV